MPGLIPILKRVSVVPDFVKTIIPGRMYKTRNNLGKGMELRLTTSQSSKDGDAGIVSQKVLARIGSQTQEV